MLLADGLRYLGHEVRILAAKPLADKGPSFADYHCYGAIGAVGTLLQAFNLSAYIRLRNALQDFQPDVVHVRMFLTQLSPLILPLLRGVPSVCHIVWLRAICPTGLKRLPDGQPCQTEWGLNCLKHNCLNLRNSIPLLLQMQLWQQWRTVFDRFVTNSIWLQKELTAHGFEDVRVVWNGVPNVKPRPPLGEAPVVGFAGRLVEQKGCDVLIEAFHRLALPEARLLIVGEGPERERLAALAERKKLANQVQFTGHLSQQRLEETLREAWVQVVPSKYSEGFGFVAIESMMRGTVVVASRCGGLEEVVATCPAGRLVAPSDVDELADSLRELLTDKEKTETLGRECRETALSLFTQERFVGELVELFEEAIRSFAQT